ncbi:MAG TPA: phosphoenolpyruvate mutase [Acetobacteraceae bacterium]
MPDTSIADDLNAVGARPARLRALLEGPGLSFIMEAHSGLSAKVVEEAGFAGIWASGLSMSAMLGLRDSNEASWTQVLDQLEFMADATRLPILVDGDTGHGNFNNVRRLVRKLGERGVAGVCIEDKLFPKTNSFIGEGQPLADVAEFCGRIRAGKDAQTTDDFCLVARIEALVSGQGMSEALRRAEAYHAAGADAVLIHSKKAHAGEITEFMGHWGGRCPVVIVPTMYHATPTEAFRRAGVSLVIWANHLLRASLSAMRGTARQIARDESLHETEGRVASVADIFRLVGNDELEEAERRYLPDMAPPRAVVLAAGRGARLGALTQDRPACMVDVRGRPLLTHLVDALNGAGIREVTVVRGYRKDAIALPGIRTVDNDEYATTGEAASLACAAGRLTGDSVVAYGDLMFRRYILDGMMAVPGDIVVAVDAAGVRTPHPHDVVRADRAYSATDMDEQPPALLGMGDGGTDGEWIGLLRATPAGSALIRAELEAMRADGSLDAADLPALIGRIASRHRVSVHYVTGHWLDVDTLGDLADARNFG